MQTPQATTTRPGRIQYWRAQMLVSAAMAVGNIHARLRRPKFYRYMNLSEWAWNALRRERFDAAESLANELLSLAETMPRGYMYGIAIHDANQILGLVALKHNDIEQAKQRLLTAASISELPDVSLVDPSFILPRELLLLGEREVVLKYLNMAEVFWLSEFTPAARNEDYQRFLLMGRANVGEWKRVIRAGGIPSDVKWTGKQKC